ncbi:DOMON-like domain-containing protein [Hydrogenophaga sp. 5NK40-0174]|uniref:DOMON-like domain-containing protein n=1 Tax=Hydrogenophaga sp. 5NK40-0174 TaxID=3127649 RepID=UPI00310321B1
MMDSHHAASWPEVPLALQAHPVTSAPWSGGLSVHIALVETPEGPHLQLEYLLQGPIARLKWPEPNPQAEFTDGLWQHTCMEAFVGAAGSEAYREFNFSPSGDWAIYDFSRCRERTTSALPALAPAIACTPRESTLLLTARVPFADVPSGPSLQWNLSAVLEDHDGQLSYWALAHPADKPDFHHPQARALTTPSIAPCP